MKFIRSIILYAALGISLLMIWQTFLRTPCARVLDYDIGLVDGRFNLGQDKLIQSIEAAANTWEQVSEHELFRYTPGADFKINLIFSEEQDRLHKGNDIEAELDSQQGIIDSNQNRYQSAVSRHQKAVLSYEQKLKKYEEDVDYWNAQGGAPEDEFQQLTLRASELDRSVGQINNLKDQVNNIVEENNSGVDNYNSNIEEYNSLFQEDKEFDAGDTDGTEINIYSYDGLEELHVLLVHEFGHVLGIDHLEDPASVMYYLLNKENTLGEISENDYQALKESCRLK